MSKILVVKANGEIDLHKSISNAYKRYESLKARKFIPKTNKK